MTDELKALADLLPCPFCGGNAHIGTVRYSRPLQGVWWDGDETPITEAFYGHCCRCAANHCSSIAGGYRTEAEAVAKWNTRDNLPAIIEQREALERQSDNIAFILDHVSLPEHLYCKFQAELAEDRAALNPTGEA